MGPYLSAKDIESFQYVNAGIVYDIAIEGNKNYFLSGKEKDILVHNSSKTYSIYNISLCTASSTPTSVKESW